MLDELNCLILPFFATIRERTGITQMFPRFTMELRNKLFEQYSPYIKRYKDKRHVPLYLFLSGASTGKSRNAAELHRTAYNCFNGTHFQK